LAEHGDKVDADTKTAIETARDELKDRVEDDDAEDDQGQDQALMEASMKLGEAIYKAEAQAGGRGGTPKMGGSGASKTAMTTSSTPISRKSTTTTRSPDASAPHPGE
jgi:molecular chaperone DnaK